MVISKSGILKIYHKHGNHPQRNALLYKDSNPEVTGEDASRLKDAKQKDISISVALEQTDEVAREHMSARLSSGFVQQFTTPPSIFRCGRNRNDIS